MRYNGYVDVINELEIVGWAVDEHNPQEKVFVDIIVNQARVMTVSACLYREDLLAAGLGDGCAQFVCSVSPYVRQSKTEISVVYSGTDLILPNGEATIENPCPIQEKGLDTPPSTSGAGSNPWNADEPFSYSEIWLGTAECRKRIRLKISGDENTDWLPYFMKKYMTPALDDKTSLKVRRNYKCLILGSNEGDVELELCRNGFVGQIVATDIADKAIARARQKTEEAGFSNVEHVIADLNSASFEGPFDFVIAGGVLHHIEKIERCLCMLSTALAKDGWLAMVEFEGPVRFQLPEFQVRWINAALGVIPKGLRAFPHDKEQFFPATPAENQQLWCDKPPKDQVIASDPSEAICGPDLKRLIPEIFDVVERKGFGGSILAYITDHFAFARANSDDFANTWLNVLMEIEDALIKSKMLDDEFVFYVVKKRY